MKNLDQSISNKNILDESFSNYSGNDVTTLRAGISELKSKLAQYKIDLDATYQTANPAIIGTRSSLKSKINTTNSLISNLESQLAKIPKSVIDAIDKIAASNAQLSLEEKKKLEAAELLALQNKNKEIQDAIDKAKGVTGILDDKLNGNVKSLPSDSAPVMKTEEPSIFSTKNIIITVSVIGLLIGGYFVIKHFKK